MASVKVFLAIEFLLILFKTEIKNKYKGKYFFFPQTHEDVPFQFEK